MSDGAGLHTTRRLPPMVFLSATPPHIFDEPLPSDLTNTFSTLNDGTDYLLCASALSTIPRHVDVDTLVHASL